MVLLMAMIYYSAKIEQNQQRENVHGACPRENRYLIPNFFSSPGAVPKSHNSISK